MQNSIWKLTALAGVVGIGFLVVLQAQRGLSRPDTNAPAELVSADGASADSLEAADGGTEEPFRENDPFGDASLPPEQNEDAEIAPPENRNGLDNPEQRSREGAPVATASPPLTPIPRRRGLDFREADPTEGRDVESAEIADEPLQPEPDPFGPEPVVAGSDAEPNPFGSTASKAPARAQPIELAGFEQSAEEGSASPPSENGGSPSGAGDGEAMPGPQLFAPSPTKLASAEESQLAEADLARGESSALRDPAEDPDAGFAGEPAEDAFGSELEPAPFDLDPPSAPTPKPRAEPSFGDEPNPFGDPVEPRATSPSVPLPRDLSTPEPSLPRPTLEPEPEDDAFDASPFGDAPSRPRMTREPAALPALEPSAEPELADPKPVPESLPTIEPERDAPPFGDAPSTSPFGDSDPQPIPRRARPSLPETPAARPALDQDRAVPRATPRDLKKRGELPVPQAPPPRSRRALPESPESRDQPNALDPPDAARMLPTPRPTLSGDGTVGPAAPGGAQRPQLKIEKLAPPNAVLGQPLIYEIAVRNIGESAAHEVMVEDRIPKGSELSGTDPQAELADKTLIWKLGTMHPGDERKIRVKVVPVSEGQIGSVATVNFVAEVAAKTVITAAKLKFDLTAPPKARVGEQVPFVFRVTNTGSADARKIVVRDLIPETFQHPDGNDLEYEMGTLGPGKSKEVKLTLVAAKPGEAVNKAVVTADGGVSLEAEAAVEILGTALHLSRTGPQKRFLGRAAVYETTVTNQSDRPVGGARIFETVPKGMDFVEATAGGQFDPVRRVIAWQLEALSPGQSKVLQVKLLPKTAGMQESVVHVVEANGSRSQVKSETEIAGIPALTADLSGLTGPIAVGEQVAFQVQVRNRGTDTGRNVRVRLELPEGLELVSAEGATVGDDGTVDFPPLASVEPRAESMFKIVLKGSAPGDARLRVQLEADHMQQPLTQEEQVIVFSDAP